MSDKVYVVTKDGKPIPRYLPSESAAWDDAAMKSRMIEWWSIKWEESEAQKNQLRAIGYDVCAGRVLIEGIDDDY